MYEMKSVRVRAMKGRTEGAMPASWNGTAIYCHDEKMPCVKRNETKHGSHMAHKRHGLSSWTAHKRNHKPSKSGLMA